MKITRITSRKFERYTGCAGSILGIFSSFHYFIFNCVNFSGMTILGFLAIIGSFLGFWACYYVIEKTEIAGVTFIIVTILIVLHSTMIGVLGAILLLIAGISALFRK